MTIGALGQMVINEYQTINYRLIRPKIGMYVQIVSNDGKISHGKI